MQSLIPWQYLTIGLGAAVGAGLRAWLGRLNDMDMVGRSIFWQWLPLGTLIANVLGGLLIGMAFILFEQIEENISAHLRPLVITGFLGGLTTFSTFSAEVFLLINQGRIINGLCLVALHVLLTLIATALGFFASKALLV